MVAGPVGESRRHLHYAATSSHQALWKGVVTPYPRRGSPPLRSAAAEPRESPSRFPLLHQELESGWPRGYLFGFFALGRIQYCCCSAAELARHWPSGALGGSAVPLTCPPVGAVVVCFEHFPSSSHFLLLSESLAVLPGSPGPLLLENGVRDHDLGADVISCCRAVAASKSAQLTKKELPVCTLTCVPVSLYCALQTLCLTNSARPATLCHKSHGSIFPAAFHVSYLCHILVILAQFSSVVFDS